MVETEAILSDFTPTELNILALLSKGYDNSTIAENLNYQVSTVEQNLNRIYSKFETSTSFKGMTKRVVAARLFLIANGQLSNFDIGHMR